MIDIIKEVILNVRDKKGEKSIIILDDAQNLIHFRKFEVFECLKQLVEDTHAKVIFLSDLDMESYLPMNIARRGKTVKMEIA